MCWIKRVIHSTKKYKICHYFLIRVIPNPYDLLSSVDYKRDVMTHIYFHSPEAVW